MASPARVLLIVVYVTVIAVLLAIAQFGERVGVTSGRLMTLGVAAAALISLAVGLALRGRPRPPTPAIDTDAEPERDATAAMTLFDAETRPASRAAANQIGDPDVAVVLFAQELLSATTRERLRAVLSRHLPPLVGTRKFWISSLLQGRRQMILPEGNTAKYPEQLIEVDGQQWTTFVLRADGAPVGVFGVESDPPLPPRLVRLIKLIAPMIGQAVQTSESMDQLRKTSAVDPLTRVVTRAEGGTRLQSELKRAQRTGRSMAVLMLDVDQFKSVNDRFGHAAGDAVLTAVGRIMLRRLRASDLRCRWGGEEFLIALPETDLSRAQVVADGLLRSIASTSVTTPAGPVSVTACIGLTMTRPSEIAADAIIRRADLALYQAKAAGRGCVRVVLGDRQGNPIAAGPRPATSAAGAPATSAFGGHHDSAATPAVPTASGQPTMSSGARAVEPFGSNTLPFADRRNPRVSDRRGVPGPGRREGDWRGVSEREKEQAPEPNGQPVQAQPTPH